MEVGETTIPTDSDSDDTTDRLSTATASSSKNDVKQKKLNRKPTVRKFKKEWLQVEDFKTWLIKKLNGKGDAVPYCKICSSELGCAITTIKRHMKCSSHRHNEERYNEEANGSSVRRQRQITSFVFESSEKK
jgi:hypothetical protein